MTPAWLRRNTGRLAIIAIAVFVEIVRGDYWLGGQPISVYIAFGGLLALVALSFKFVRFSERLLLLASYLWVSWSIVRTFAIIYERFGLASGAANPGDALYMSICIWALLGFESIVPSAASREWVQVQAILAVIGNALMVALVLRLLTPSKDLGRAAD